MKAGKKPMYDGKCRDKGLEKSENTVLRLKTPNDGEVRFNDLVRGEVVFNNSELDDLILLEVMERQLIIYVLWLMMLIKALQL
ncbi:MAG: hypothetical protein CM15mP17_09100 [Gammaproteobacteria bacterium]|nr:MAG: hypothetical protein CM15mP17_09100 [Gammaproteobacteria bacterium]